MEEESYEDQLLNIRIIKAIGIFFLACFVLYILCINVLFFVSFIILYEDRCW